MITDIGAVDNEAQLTLQFPERTCLLKNNYSSLMKKFFFKIVIIVCLCNNYAYAQIAITEERKTAWHHFEKTEFKINGIEAWYVKPKIPIAGNSWIWRAYFPSWRMQMDSILLEPGFYVAYVNTNNLFGHLKAMMALSYTYGISIIPGTLVDNIYVSKGANSVLQGYESISGQINVETKEPDNTDKWLLNVYTNNFLEKQFNANYAFKKGKSSDLHAFHTIQPANKIDRDHDTFLDLPLLTRYMIFNKWKYGNDRDWGWSSRIGVRYLNEQRIDGQTFFNVENDKGTTNAYGQTVNIKQPELWTKTSYHFNDNHKISFIASTFYQDQNSYFGTTKYAATQTNTYANLQYELFYNEKHILKTGISYRHLNLNENIAFTANPLNRTHAGEYKKAENIPGKCLLKGFYNRK